MTAFAKFKTIVVVTISQGSGYLPVTEWPIPKDRVQIVFAVLKIWVIVETSG
jgi:hypothetical protein